MRKLTEKQKNFIKAYLKGSFCGAAAVCTAYPSVKNRNVAAVMAHALKANQKIRRIIEEQFNKHNDGANFKDFEIIE